MELKVKKLHKDAVLPDYSHDGDAGADLGSVESYSVESGMVCLVSTGLAMEIPFGYVGLIWDRSGVSTKNTVKTLAGVIDAGYRGEVKVALLNLNSKPFQIEKGMKVAQILIQKVESPIVVEVDELSDTARGDGGFGSTGIK
jgi:dUTP pyrophosphatase